MKHWESLVRVIFAAHNDIEEWRIADPELAAARGFPREFASAIVDDHGIVFVDVALDAATGEPICHEVNGPNAVGSDALTGESSARAASEVAQTIRRARERGLVREGRVTHPFVTLHAHQHWRSFRTGGELYPRVARFAAELEARLGASVALRGPRDALGDEAVSVIVGDVPSVGAHLTVAHETFAFRDRPVAFVGNPNLLWELVRLGRLVVRDGRVVGADLRALHAGRLAHVIHDKALQQRLCEGTGLRPLRHFEARSRAEALAMTRAALADGPVVLKPNAGSGGTGVHVVVAAMDDAAILAVIDRLVGDVAAKYGANCEATLYPLRGFEFVRSTPYPLADGGHLWDLRIALELSPGRIRAYPVTFRLAPAPFDAGRFHTERDMWISNVSGRDVTFLKSGLDRRELAKVGIDDAGLDRIIDASVRWLERAWDGATRDPGGRVFEDEAELAEPGFYPRERFAR